MNIEQLPRVFLSYGACLISGFILGVWCMPNTAQRTPSKKPRLGFTISIPTVGRDIEEKLSQLNGKSLRLTRTLNESKERCYVNHYPFEASINNETIYLFVPIKFMESVTQKISHTELANLDLLEAKQAAKLPECIDTPKITYGD
jgi:hypothetical protein